MRTRTIVTTPFADTKGVGMIAWMYHVCHLLGRLAIDVCLVATRGPELQYGNCEEAGTGGDILQRWCCVCIRQTGFVRPVFNGFCVTCARRPRRLRQLVGSNEDLRGHAARSLPDSKTLTLPHVRSLPAAGLAWEISATAEQTGSRPMSIRQKPAAHRASARSHSPSSSGPCSPAPYIGALSSWSSPRCYRLPIGLGGRRRGVGSRKDPRSKEAALQIARIEKSTPAPMGGMYVFFRSRFSRRLGRFSVVCGRW